MKPKRSRSLKRLDLLLVERGLTDSQKSAQAMILAGEVKLDGVPARKAGMQIGADARIELAHQQEFVSRGGLKLEGALEDFSIDPAGLVCLDIGASTGGFTDCLLSHGAARVFALDVNVSQLAWRLQQDPLVFPVERNARNLSCSDLAEEADLVVVDVSFISVGKILVPAVACAKAGGTFLVLVKPQFELRREEVPRGGVVTDQKLHGKAIAAVKHAAEKAGLRCLQVLPSRLQGAQGNQEYFLHALKH